MEPSLRSRCSVLLLSSALGMSTACTILPLPQTPPNAAPSTETTPSPPATTAPTAIASPLPSPARPDPFQLAVDRASSAVAISQSAQSRDDWRLVANRWQQAMDLLAQVPDSNPNYGQAQSKLAEYRRNLSYAQQQASRPTTPEAGGVVAIAPQPRAAQGTTSNPSPSQRSQPNPVAANPGRVYRAPIVRRAGGTPVISVAFNGNRRYDMIVDTGASGTLITQSMARELGLVAVGQTRVDTASARSVSFPLGYVRSIQVDDAIATNVLVAVAGPELDLGLLGHDFFGNYDVTIREDVVEFHER